MRLSDDKINNLSHILLDCLRENPEVTFREEGNEVRLNIKSSIVESLDLFDQVDRKVQETLSSYSRKIIEGSREWDVMYTKLYDEEIKKLRAV